jgi:hypothetical protein
MPYLPDSRSNFCFTMTDPFNLALLLLAAFAAGALNAVAGGGSFLTLPALVFAGVARKYCGHRAVDNSDFFRVGKIGPNLNPTRAEQGVIHDT